MEQVILIKLRGIVNKVSAIEKRDYFETGDPFSTAL